MLVGIDASRAIRPVQTGTEIYSRQLIAALASRPTSNRYRLYVDRNPGSLLPTGERTETRIIPLERAWTHLRLGFDLVRDPPDLLFVPSHVVPLVCRVPSVVTIHDVGYLWYRSAYSPLAWILLHLGTIRNARGARRIVVDSRATANDLIHHFGVPANRLHVAYLGGPNVEEIAPDPSVRARYGLAERYFLFVGTLQPRKNVPGLLRAFAELRRRMAGPVDLVLVGQPGRGEADLRTLARKLGVEDYVRWLGYVPATDRPSLFASASALVFPSLYEGFGLPPLEAMAWGTPVITSNTSSLPEVVGDAGILVNPRDVTELANAMARILDDLTLRERLIAAGRVQAARFTWDRCASDVELAFLAAR